MEKHVLAAKPSVNKKLVDQEFAEACETTSKKRKRDYEDGFVKDVTDMARQVGAKAAARKYRTVYQQVLLLKIFFFSFWQVPEGTIKAWLFHFQKKGTYHQPNSVQHGRPPFLSTEQRNEVVESIERLAARPNAAPIRGRGVAAIARGIVCRTTPQVNKEILFWSPSSLFYRFWKNMGAQGSWALIGESPS